MKIKMLKSTMGSLDGLRVTEYTKDKIYDESELNDSLIKTFLRDGVAVEVKEQMKTETTVSDPEPDISNIVDQCKNPKKYPKKSKKSKGAAPENKSK